MKLAILILLIATAVSSRVQAADAPHPPATPHQATADKPAPAVKTVNPAEFEALRAKPETVVLDVRTPKEFAEGHVPNAVNIDVNAPDFEKKVKALDPKKTYLIHCRSGARGTTACEKLGKLNFPNVYNLAGGIRAWEKAGNKPAR